MVVWTDLAKNDLKNIHNFIAKDSKFYAKRVMYEIVEKSESLQDFPNLGRIFPELNNSDIRELSINSYRLIYEIISNDIIVLTVVHKRHDFGSDDINSKLI